MLGSFVEESGYVQLACRRERLLAAASALALACSFSSFPTGIFQYHSIPTKNPNPACSDLLHPFFFRVLASLAATCLCLILFDLHPLALRGKAASFCRSPPP